MSSWDCSSDHAREPLAPLSEAAQDRVRALLAKELEP